MKAFLSKFMDADKVVEIEEAYKAKNPEAQSLPTYIPKTRFDEVDSKRKIAEEALKAIPGDWQEQLETSKIKLAEQKTSYEKQLEEQKNTYEGKLNAAATTAERTAKIYGAGARNVKAVMALIDDSKPVDEQLKALQESDPYLFIGSGVAKGTGKGDGNHGGDGDGKRDGQKLSTADMYRAVGIAQPAN